MPETAAYLHRLVQIDAVISGPTGRCMRTAMIIGHGAGLAPVLEQRLIPISGRLEAQVTRPTEMMTQITAEHVTPKTQP